ncbi:mannosyltransferase [Ciceribacter lividus]|uniref:Mannosyltransferase n=1 Tax=Ciceribacter lividus TaxID=1197950 RepID=A0A6I7HTI3_9HYPH|nr:glycosyltransferase family 4 protein [Ciceribacter lividus]RCW28272.1 mannosyltransferase [Ciceribacter lividus]
MTDIADVEVIAPNFKQRLSGVTSTIIQLVPVQTRLGQKVATLGPGLPSSLPRIGYADLLRLWKRLRSGRKRVWHARRNNEMLAGLVLRDLLRMPIKVLFTSASQRKHTRWTKALIARVDAVVATSARTAAYLEVENSVVMHGIDTARFFPPADKTAAKQAVGLDPEKKIAGCFGRVRHQKGTDLFVDAMIALLSDRPDWSAIVAGRATASHATFETELKERVTKAGLSDRILFVGEHANINDWYRALDLFVAPQRWEGFGLTPLEAMATAVPVVATDVGAFPELVVTGRDETGIVIPADDLAAMTNAAGAFMDDPARLSAAGARALAHVSGNFSIEGEARRLGEIYRRLIDDAP